MAFPFALGAAATGLRTLGPSLLRMVGGKKGLGMLAAGGFPFYGGGRKLDSTPNKYEGTADQNKQLAEAYGYDTGQSLVDQMNSQGMDFSFDARAEDFANIGQGTTGLQQPQEMPSPTMFGQFGDPSKTMGSIFDQLNLGRQKIGQGLQGLGSSLDSEYQRNLSRLGMGPVKNLKNPMPPEVAAIEEPTITPEPENSGGFLSRFLNYGQGRE